MNARGLGRAAGITLTVVSLVVVGYGAARVTTPEVEPEVVTVYKDLPPACGKALDAVDLAITHWDSIDQHEDIAIAATDGLMPALLAGDAKQVREITEASESEKRLAGAAQTKRDAALSEYEQAAADCVPERQP
jgi:hypothetical protein